MLVSFLLKLGALAAVVVVLEQGLHLVTLLVLVAEVERIITGLSWPLN
jgi:hypothetical protein